MMMVCCSLAECLTGCGSMLLATDAVHSIAYQSRAQHCFAALFRFFSFGFLSWKTRAMPWYFVCCLMFSSGTRTRTVSACLCVCVSVWARVSAFKWECCAVLRLPCSPNRYLCGEDIQVAHAHAFLIISLSEVGRFGDAINFIGITSGSFVACGCFN